MLRLADTEHVVAIKWDVPPDEDYDAMREFTHLFNVIDNCGYAGARTQDRRRRLHQFPYRRLPPYDKKVWGLLEAHTYDEAQAEWDRVGAVLQSDQCEVQQALWRLPHGQGSDGGAGPAPSRADAAADATHGR